LVEQIRVVKSPLTFLEIYPKMGLGNTIEFEYMALGPVLEILDPVDVG